MAMMQGQVLSALASSPAENGRAAPSAVRRWYDIAAVLLALAALALVGQAIFAGWQIGDWNRFGDAIYVATYVLLCVFLLTRLTRVPILSSEEALTPILTAAAAGDEERAPLAERQPAPMTPEELAAGELRFTRLRRMPSAYQRQLMMAPLMPLYLLVVTMWLPLAFGFTIDDSAFWLTIILAVILILACSIVPAIVMARRNTRHTIIADANGLRWQARNGEPFTMVPWEAIRSFSRVGYQSHYSGTYLSFLVDAGSERLGWQMLTTSKDDEYREMEQLARVIVARSGKPLRNLSDAKDVAYQRYTTWIGQPLLALPAETRAAFKAANRRATKRVFRWAIPTSLFFMLLALSAFFLPQRAYDWQQSYFAGLVPQIETAPLLYHNALTTPSADWPIIQPTAQNSFEWAGFTNGVYTMTAPQLSAQELQNIQNGLADLDPIGGNSLTALLPHSYGNVAIAATMRAVPGKTSQEAGLVLRANGPTLLVFEIELPSQYWRLYRYPAPPDPYFHASTPYSDQLAVGTSAAINTGAGATNRLLAVVRGQVVLLYANGHYLGSFATSQVSGVFVRPSVDNYGHPPIQASGQPGLFVGDESSADFSDFSVYAIPSPPALNYA